MGKPFISYSTDFGPGNKGHATMRAIAFQICSEAEIVEGATNIPGGNLTVASHLFESVKWLPVGFHVCVCDPGVGTKRRGVIIKTKRGDCLIGPDNGILINAAEFLGGIEKAVEITNRKYMNKEVSPVFHGRDVFMPAVAWLAKGVRIEEFGGEIKVEDLAKPPYENAVVRNGKIEAEVIDINQFGNVFLNVLQETMHGLYREGEFVEIEKKGKNVKLPYLKTFGDVPIGKPVILDDDFGRVEAAINQGNFAKKFKVKVGDRMRLRKVA